MIETTELRDLIATYAKHGWLLRRVLLSAGSREKLDDAGFDAGLIMDSGIDAAWFSRPPKPGGVPWEIRYLGGSPFALVENIDEDAGDLENQLAGVESRLRAAVTGKKPA